MIATQDIEKVERQIILNDRAPLLPEEKYIPWHIASHPEEVFMPFEFISLGGHPLFKTLSTEQKRELSKREMLQVMYSYAWSEALACYSLNQRVKQVPPGSVDYHGLLKELIEEFGHQDMFSRIMMKLKVKPYKPSWIHKAFTRLYLNLLPPDALFMSVLATGLVTDVYRKAIRSDYSVFEPLRKITELHNIGEGRHIHYAKLWLNNYAKNAGFFKSTFYSLIVLGNVYFMRRLYVRKAIFKTIGVENPEKYTDAAKRNLKKKFGKYCLHDVISFVNRINGLNFLTKPLWRWVLKADI